MGDQILTKDDLFNMMESYKSNIEFNKQLLSSQEKILVEHDKVINKLAKITKSQETLGIHLEHLIKDLTDHNNNCTTNIASAADTMKEINIKIDSNNISNIKEHGKLRYHLIAISGSLVAVVIALVVALGKMWDKVDIIDEVSKHLGI